MKNNILKNIGILLGLLIVAVIIGAFVHFRTVEEPPVVTEEVATELQLKSHTVGEHNDFLVWFPEDWDLQLEGAVTKVTTNNGSVWEMDSPWPELGYEGEVDIQNEERIHELKDGNRFVITYVIREFDIASLGSDRDAHPLDGEQFGYIFAYQESDGEYDVNKDYPHTFRIKADDEESFDDLYMVFERMEILAN